MVAGLIYFAGLTHSGLSLRGLLTCVETGKAFISEAGYGFNRGSNFEGAFSSGANHKSYASGGKITGMRLWIGFIISLGSVVMMALERISDPLGDCHRSQSPANAKGSPDFNLM